MFHKTLSDFTGIHRIPDRTVIGFGTEINGKSRLPGRGGTVGHLTVSRLLD